LTEISCKFKIKDFENLVEKYFEIQNVWTDEQKKFGVLYLKVKL